MPYAAHYGDVNAVSLSEDQSYALSGGYDKEVKLWDVETGECLRVFRGHEDEVTSVCLSSDGRYALSGSRDETIRLWEVDSDECVQIIKESGAVESVSISADGRYAVSTSSDLYHGVLRIWDLWSGRCVGTLGQRKLTKEKTHYACVACISRDGRFVLEWNEVALTAMVN